MIKEYLLINNTLYPMLPDGSENIDIHDSKMWNVFRGNELVGIITSSTFQPVLGEFMKYENMRVYFYDKDDSDDAETLDIYALAKHGEEIKEYNTSKNKKTSSNTMRVQEALPDKRILNEIDAHQKIVQEKQHQHSIIKESSQTPPLIDSLRKDDKVAYEITAIFGKTIDEVIKFLKAEGNAVGFDAMVGIHEEKNQRCIVMHESEEHRIERERKTEELRTSGISKLTDEEKRALGIGRDNT